MKFVTWNVNGLRACITKGFNDYFKDADADFFSIQESKMQEGQADIDIEGYNRFMSSAEKKGYSGTIIYTKEKPLTVVYGIHDKYNDEGRVITLEYDKFYLVNAYVPNSKEGLTRLDYRMIYEDDLRNYLSELNQNKPVIYCGDLNVAHEKIDLKNPDSNTKNPGFSPEERAKMTELLAAGFTDTYRSLYPTKIEYSWWSYRFNARANNAGWRIDYFIVSNSIKDLVKDVKIRNDIYGSDHCPVELYIEM